MATSYKDIFNLFELFTTLLPLAHLFAIALYWVSFFDEDNNWILVNNLGDLGPYEKYIYSLYFTLTTMLTVGYGDISPVNVNEILVILIVQIVGIATYGFIISEIGHIISSLRQDD